MPDRVRSEEQRALDREDRLNTGLQRTRETRFRLLREHTRRKRRRSPKMEIINTARYGEDTRESGAHWRTIATESAVGRVHRGGASQDRKFRNWISVSLKMSRYNLSSRSIRVPFSLQIFYLCAYSNNYLATIEVGRERIIDERRHYRPFPKLSTVFHLIDRSRQITMKLSCRINTVSRQSLN